MIELPGQWNDEENKGKRREKKAQEEDKAKEDRTEGRGVKQEEEEKVRD